MSTNNLSVKEIKRTWHLIDMKDQILGRVATKIATILMGKNKPSYVPYLDTGDFVVVINSAHVKVTGKKEKDKKYIRHSGYPGGYREEILGDLRSRRPEAIITHAVKGMVPKTKLGREMLKKLHVYAGDQHPYASQIKESEGKEVKD